MQWPVGHPSTPATYFTDPTTQIGCSLPHNWTNYNWKTFTENFYICIEQPETNLETYTNIQNNVEKAN